jgi:hypothetical protein
MVNVHKYISDSLSRRKKGSLVFLSDFRGSGSETAIRSTLSRLAKEGKIVRLAQGIYLLPKKDPLLGIVFPGAEEVAEAIAQKERLKIKPAGAYAVHRLGLTSQVPTRLVYITDGENRQIKMGKMVIRFKATTPKKMATQGKISALVIQALEELGTEKIDNTTREKIKDLLMKEDPSTLKKDLTLAPGRIHDFILHLLKKTNDRLVTTHS